MTHTTPRARRTALPWGLVGMLALVAAGEWSFARVEMDVIAPWHWDWRNTGQAARSGVAKRADVLCFGDSLIKFSVLPPVVEARTGRAAYNLGVALGQPPSSYVLLRRALNAGARPKVVVLEAVPVFLRESPRVPRHLRQWPEMLSIAEAVEMAWTMRDADFLAAVSLARLVPTLRAREEIRTGVRNALGGTTANARFTAAQFWRNARVNRGANVMPEGAFHGDTAGEFGLVCGAFGCDPVNATYLDRFLALAASRKLPVVWVVPPMVDEMQRMAAASGFVAAQTEFLRSYQRRYPDLAVVDGRGCGYGRALCHDPIHMNRAGALAFSDELAPLLDRAVAGERLPRWVSLPALRARPGAPAVEDISDSALILTRRAGSTARR